MSRFALLLVATSLSLSLPAMAQDAAEPETAAGQPQAGDEEGPEPERLTAQDFLEDDEPLVGPPLPPGCESDPLNNSVVICAPRDDEKFRVPKTIDPDRVDAFGDVPRAPDVFGIPNHGVVVGRGCFIPPCPPEQPIIIDLDAIPEAPPGSDADRVARGLAPRGNEEGSGLPEPQPLEDVTAPSGRAEPED